LGNEKSQAPHKKNTNDCSRNDPKRKAVFSKTLVEEGLKEGWNKRLRGRGHHGSQYGKRPNASLLAEVGPKTAHPFQVA
jgi:hypothetical protein